MHLNWVLKFQSGPFALRYLAAWLFSVTSLLFHVHTWTTRLLCCVALPLVQGGIYFNNFLNCQSWRHWALWLKKRKLLHHCYCGLPPALTFPKYAICCNVEKFGVFRFSLMLFHHLCYIVHKLFGLLFMSVCWSTAIPFCSSKLQKLKSN